MVSEGLRCVGNMNMLNLKTMKGNKNHNSLFVQILKAF